MMSLNLGELIERQEKYADARGIPLVGTFELTSRCNLGCVMCYVKETGADTESGKSIIKEKFCQLTARQWLQIAREARDAGMLYLLLTGGEVFLRKDFKEIYQGLMELGLIVTIFTNATLITEEIADFLAKRPPRLVSVTLYGASEDTYEKVTGSRGAYRQALEGIRLLKEGKIRLEIKTTLIQANKGDLFRIYDYAHMNGFNFGLVHYVFPGRETMSPDSSTIRLSPEELVEIESSLKTYIRKKEKGKSQSQNLKIGGDLDQEREDVLSQGKKEILKKSKFLCSVGKSSFWLRATGDMIPCGSLSEPSIHMRTSFIKTWRDMQELVLNIPTCDKCQSCELKERCMSCPALLYAENRRFDLSADYICKYAELRQKQK